MSRWNDLYEHVRRTEDDGRESERRVREDELRRAALDEWADRALEDVWLAIHAGVVQHATELRAETGLSVSYAPAVRWVSAPGELPSIRVLDVRLGSSVAYLYSHHGSGSLPSLLVAHWRQSPADHRRHHRMLSLPICRVEPAGSSWLLRGERTGGLALGPVLEVDDLVFRAFELVVLGKRRPGAARSFRTLALGSPPE